MPNNVSLRQQFQTWRSSSSTSKLPVLTQKRRMMALQSLTGWGKSRSTNQLMSQEGSVSKSTSSSTTTTTTTTTTISSSSSNSVVTQIEEEGEEATVGTCRRGPTSRQATASSCRSHQEVLTTPSSSSQETMMEVEESAGSTTTSHVVESGIPPCADGLVIGNKKRASSLEMQRDRRSEACNHHDHEHHVQKQARSTTTTLSDRFISVLDRPFKYWQELNRLLKEIHPDWSPYQRGRMIHHLIHFLELKIGLEEVEEHDDVLPTTTTGSSLLLLPTPVVDLAWRALVLETSLYLQVIHTLQDFHDKNQQMIHYSILGTRHLSPKEVQDKIQRTQSLFRVYFKENMPCSIVDEPKHCPVYIPSYTRQSRVCPTLALTERHNQDCQESPPTTTTNTPTTTTMVDLSSLSHKHDSVSGLSLREDETASTQASDDDSECLMGLELLD